MKWLLLFLVNLVVTLMLLELSLPLLHRRYAPYFRQDIATAKPNLDDARRFFNTKGGMSSKHPFVFDPELGWDMDPIARNYVASKRYVAQSYGDSFTMGAEVGSESTWQAQMERLTGEPILNLGVAGYGLDQAVLKFDKYARHYQSPIAILGLYPEMYRRALSYHSFYYFENHDAFKYVFKPIFIKRDGQFELLRPPCADATCLMGVLSSPDNDVWRFLAHYDYWYQVNERKPVPGFPNTVKYARVLRTAVQERRARRARKGAGGDFFVNAESLDVAEYLIQRFVNDSKEMGMTPVCLLLYSPSDLRVITAGIRLDDNLLKFLEASGIHYVDTSRYILDHYRQEDRFESLRAPKGHLSPQGNLLVAEALAQGMVSMGLATGRQASENAHDRSGD